MTSGESSVQRLTRALEVFLAHQAAPEASTAELLARHGDLADLLAPMFADDREAAPDAASPERTFGAFRLLGEIARGGMGVVHDALHLGLNRRVALKLLANPLAASPHAVARFRREAELLARLQHAHIVPVHDAGVVDGVPFHAMERIDGGTLGELLRVLARAPRDRLDGQSLANAHRHARGRDDAGSWLVAETHVDAVLRVAIALADALVTAHAAGILHRDVKPANVLLRTDGTPLLSDFGLARDVREPGLSRPGERVGTPFYMAPEQAAGDLDRIGPATDVFALGVVAYEMLFLVRPFDGETSEAVLARVLDHEPRELMRRDHALPADLVAVLDMALRKEPSHRYASMAAFAADLRAVRASQPVLARRRGPWSRAWQRLRARPRRTAAAVALFVCLGIAGASLAFALGQRDRIAAGTELEVLPRVDAMLLRVLLQQECGARGGGLADALAAHALLPERPETVAAVARAASLAGDAATAREFGDRLTRIAPDVAAQASDGEAAPEPTNALGWFVRGRWLLDKAHADGAFDLHQRAVACLRRAVDRSATVRELYFCELLHALTHTMDRTTAFALADDIQHRWPASPFVAYWRGRLFESFAPQRAVAELRRAVAGLPDLPQPSVRLAIAHEHCRQWSDALAVHERVLATWSDDLGSRTGRARCLAALGRREEALAAIDAVIADGVTHYWVTVVRGDVLRQLGRTEEAAAAYEHAITLGPQAALPRRMLAELRLAAGDAAKALPAIEAACALEPNNTAAHSTRGVVLLHLDRPRDAVGAFERVVRDWPWSDQNWRALAQARCRSGDAAAAATAIAEALRLAPDEPRHLAELGKIQRAAGKRDDAVATFARVLELAPEDYEAAVNLAGLRWERDERDEAVRLLAVARKARPDLPHAWNPSIQYLERMGRMREAVQARTELCAARPRERAPRLALVAAILALPAEAGDAQLLARVLAELAALDGGERDDVAELRRRVAARYDAAK